MLEELQTDLELVLALQAILVARATGPIEGGSDYKVLRMHLISNATYAELLPSFVRTNRTLEQFWQFIKGKFPSYAERRSYIWGEFSPLLDHLEGKDLRPLDESTSAILKSFDEESVHAVWQKRWNGEKAILKVQ